MEKSLFEQTGGIYAQAGDYLLPNLNLPKQSDFKIGIWGKRRRQFLKQNHRIQYYNMLIQCTLYPHLAEVEREAQILFAQTVNQLARQENITDELKNSDIMNWIQKMNNIHHIAAEIVLNEYIFY